MALTPWWEEWDGRLDDELAAFRNYGLTFFVDEDERAQGRIVLHGRAPVARGEEQLIRVVYPDSYPNTRPAILAPELRLDRHQNPYGGILPRASIHWRPKMTAAQLVHENVPYLVELVRQGGERLRDEEEPQGEPASTFLHYHSVGGIVVPESTLSLDSHATTGTLRIRFADDTGWLTQLFEPDVDFGWVGQALLDEVRAGRRSVLAAADQPLRQSFTGQNWSGRWCRLPRRPRSPRDVDILREVAETDRSFNRHQFANGYEIIGVVFKEEVQQDIWEDVWVFLVVHEGPPVRAALLRGMRYSRKDLHQRIPELS